jgi:hypothetical protein
MTAPTVDTYRHALAQRSKDLGELAEYLERRLAQAVEDRDSLVEVQRLVLKRAEVLAKMEVLGDLYLDAEDRILSSPEVARLLP